MKVLKKHILECLGQIGNTNVVGDRYLVAKCAGVIDSMYLLDFIDEFTYKTPTQNCKSILNNKSVNSNLTILLQFCK